MKLFLKIFFTSTIIANIKEFIQKLNISDDNLYLSKIFEKAVQPCSFYGVSTQLLPVLERFSTMNMKSSNLLDVCWKENLNVMSANNQIRYEQSEQHPEHQTIFKQAVVSSVEGLIDIEEEIIDFDTNELPLNLSQVISYLILPSLNNAYQIVMRLSTGNISIGESIKYTGFCKAEELHLLNSFFEANVPGNAITMSFLKLECALNMNK